MATPLIWFNDVFMDCRTFNSPRGAQPWSHGTRNRDSTKPEHSLKKEEETERIEQNNGGDEQKKSGQPLPHGFDENSPAENQHTHTQYSGNGDTRK